MTADHLARTPLRRPVPDDGRRVGVEVVVPADLSGRRYRRVHRRLTAVLRGRTWRLTRGPVPGPTSPGDAGPHPADVVVDAGHRRGLRHLSALPRLLAEVEGTVGVLSAVEGTGDDVLRVFRPHQVPADRPVAVRRVPVRGRLRRLRGPDRRRRAPGPVSPGAPVGDEAGPRTAGRSLQVLVLTSEAPPVISGISTTVANLEKGLTARGHAVTVLSRNDFPRYLRHEIRLSAFGLSWRTVRRHLARFDVINVHGPVPTMSEVFLLLAAGLGPHRPAIVYTHHSDLAIPRLERLCGLYNRIGGRLTQIADVVVVSSQDYAEKIADRFTDVRVVPWGVDSAAHVRTRTPREPGAPLRVLFVGQLRPYKGVDVLVEAVAELHGAVTLTVVGDGPLRATLHDRVLAAGLDHVELRGRVDDEQLWAAYAEHDVVVLPSTTTAEAYGLVLLEGMAAGCVPVGSDLPGVRQVAGPTGRLVTPGDVDSLRRVLAELSADEAAVAAASAASAALAARRTVATTAAGYESAFVAAVDLVHAQRALTVLPPPWESPQDLLLEVEAMTGARASLVLVPARGGARVPMTVWESDGGVHQERTAPVASWVARVGRPLVVGTGAAVPFEVRLLMMRRDLRAAVLRPVHRGDLGTTVLCVSTPVGSEPLSDELVDRVLRMGSPARAVSRS